MAFILPLVLLRFSVSVVINIFVISAADPFKCFDVSSDAGAVTEIYYSPMGLLSLRPIACYQTS